jgi:uncharacterized protein (TIGR02001 family)
MQTKKISRLVLAASLAAPAMMFIPVGAQAGATANVSVANMYLWRGMDVSGSEAQISGTLQYNADNGLYAGGWASSSWAGSGYELDLYAGYGGTAGDFKYDISYWEYLYPEAGFVPGDDVGLGDTDASDLVLSAGYGMFSAAAYINTDSDLPDQIYWTLGVAAGKFGATLGTWTGDDDDATDYSHLTLSYNPIETLTFKVSMASSGDTEVEEDPLVQVSYTWNFDL